MKKLLLLALILLISTANSVFAVEVTDSQIREEVRKQIINQYKKYTDADLEVIVANMPFAKVYIPDGALKYVVKSNFDKFVPRDIKKVYIYSNGKLAKEFIVSVRVKAYKDVLCARTIIERDSLLTTTNVGPRKMEVSANIDYVLSPEILSKNQILSKKWFREGEIIDKRFVKMKPDVERNSEVQAYFRNNGIMVVITGTAMSEGMVGDYIEVRNQNYRKSYRAKIIGENKVLINI
ncbi:MAG: flagellar basal body P-ring formation chaperone FlgA [Candidatus Gastranaerophilaceae bacterium]